jgi:1,4-dihydroxy-2-naphthoyl-CoA synthase
MTPKVSERYATDVRHGEWRGQLLSQGSVRSETPRHASWAGITRVTYHRAQSVNAQLPVDRTVHVLVSAMSRAETERYGGVIVSACHGGMRG